MTQTNRAELLRVASLVRPALASADYIPALTHIRFDGAYATAYNDISAIVVACELDVKRLVPGDLLIRALGAFQGEHVALAFDERTQALLLSSGRSKLKLPTLPCAEFPFEAPAGGDEVTLTPEICDAIGKCMLSIGSDQKHPAQMGVTLEAGADGCAVLYSTDNKTISRAATGSKVSLPGGSPVILPTFLCEQLALLRKAHPATDPILVLLPGALLVDFVGEANNTAASLFSKTVVDLEALDFETIFKRHADPAEVLRELVTVPDALDDAFGRSLLVLGNEAVKTAHVSAGAGSILVHSTSAMGDCDDDVPFSGKAVPEFRVDPELVVRGLKQCSKMAMRRNVLVMSDDTGAFMHLVSHVTK